jgi:hypothetical protein
LLSNWQRRYFTLQGPYIKYYADQNKIQRDLKGVLDLRVDIDDVEIKDRGQFQLLRQGEKVVSLRIQRGTGAVAEAQIWVDEIRDQLELMAGDEANQADTIVVEPESRRGISSGSIQEANRLKKLVIVSSPEFGPDGEGGYTFPVMSSIVELSKKEQAVAIAYDWADSSNTFEEDSELWVALKSATKFEEKAVLIKQTRWFPAYAGGIKRAVMMACQDGFSVLMICINGGPVSQVEAREMPLICEQIISDLATIGIADPIITVVKLDIFQDLEALVSKLRPELAHVSSTTAILAEAEVQNGPPAEAWNEEVEGVVVKKGNVMVFGSKREGWADGYLVLSVSKLVCFDSNQQQKRIFELSFSEDWHDRNLELLPDSARKSRHSQIYPFTVRSGMSDGTFAMNTGAAMWEWGVAIRWREGQSATDPSVKAALPGCNVVQANSSPLWTEPEVLQERLLQMLKNESASDKALRPGLVGACMHGAEKNFELLLATGVIELESWSRGNHPVSMALEANFSLSRIYIVQKLVANGAPIGRTIEGYRRRVPAARTIRAAGTGEGYQYTFMLTKPDRIRGTRSILGKPVHRDDKDLVQWMAEQGDGIEYNEACAESLTEAAANTKSRFVFHTSTHGGMTRLLIPAEAKAWACGTLTHLEGPLEELPGGAAGRAV